MVVMATYDLVTFVVTLMNLFPMVEETFDL
jgi:hypothetical protein